MTEGDPPIFWQARRLLGIRDHDDNPQADLAIRLEIDRAKKENRQAQMVRIERMLAVRP